MMYIRHKIKFRKNVRILVEVFCTFFEKKLLKNLQKEK